MNSGSVEVEVGRHLVHRGLATLADHQIRVVEVGRPFVSGANCDRGDSGVLEGLDVFEELIPGGGRSVDSGLGEQVLVVPEPDHSQVEGDAVLDTIDLIQTDRALVEIADESRRQVRDVLNQSGVDLLTQATAAPGLEEVRDLTRLKIGLQSGLECLVLHHRDVDRDVGVGLHELIGHVLPQGHHRIGVLDMPPLDGDGFRLRLRSWSSPRPRWSSSPPALRSSSSPRRPRRRMRRGRGPEWPAGPMVSSVFVSRAFSFPRSCAGSCQLR